METGGDIHPFQPWGRFYGFQMIFSFCTNGTSNSEEHGNGFGRPNLGRRMVGSPSGGMRPEVVS